MENERIITYIDGFNLYFGLREKGWRCFDWLNLKLACCEVGRQLYLDTTLFRSILHISYEKTII